MKSSSWTFIVLILTTLLLVAYVHEHISIYRTSYAIESKERERARLNEEYKLAKYAVSRLRSPDLLSQRLQETSLNLTIPQEHEVIKLLRAKTLSPRIEHAGPVRVAFLPLLQFIKEAQAKTSNDS